MRIYLFDLLTDVVKISYYSLPIVNSSKISTLELRLFECFDFFYQLSGFFDYVNIATI